MINVITKRGAVGPARWTVGTGSARLAARSRGTVPHQLRSRPRRERHRRSTSWSARTPRGTPIFPVDQPGVSPRRERRERAAPLLPRRRLRGERRHRAREPAAQAQRAAERHARPQRRAHARGEPRPRRRADAPEPRGRSGWPHREHVERRSAQPARRRGDTTRRGFAASLPEEYDLFFESRRHVRAGPRPPHGEPARRASDARLAEPAPARRATIAPPRRTPRSIRASMRCSTSRPSPTGAFGFKEITVRNAGITRSTTRRLRRATPPALRSSTSLGGAVLSERHEPHAVVRRGLPRRGAERDQLHHRHARHGGGLRRGRHARRLRRGAGRLARPPLRHRRAARRRQQRLRRELRPRVYPRRR